MNKKLIAYSLVAACLLTIAVTDADAQKDRRRGTAGADYLLVPVTARTASLGTTTTSGLNDMAGVEVVFSNPAGLATNPGTNALFSRMQYVADIGVNYIGIAQNFGSNNIALTVTSWDFGDIPLQTEELPEISSVTWTASYLTAGLTYARQFTDRISAGVTAKLLNEKIDDTGASGMAFDAGMTYAVGESGLRFGVSLKNLGQQMNYSGDGLVRLIRLPDQRGNATPNAVTLDGAAYELPSLLNFGVSYTRPLGGNSNVTVLGNFRSNSFTEDQYAAGVEFGLMNVLHVRGSYELQGDMDNTFYTGASFGAGLNLNLGGTGLTVDYAYRATDYFDGVNMVTASITL
ncbi:MAG: PorV/PorQ family protein [Rhodothermales bacterium]